MATFDPPTARVWLLVALTGVGAGLASGLLMRLLYGVEHWAWHFQTGTLLDAAEHDSYTHRLLVVSAAGVLAGFGMLLLYRLVGKQPTAVDKGIARGGEMPVALTLGESIVSIVIVGMGASIGREGAVKKTGGLIGSWLAQQFRLAVPDRQLLLACGAGAGLAAAYGVPMGGGLFALELLLGTLDLVVAGPALLCAALATAASWTMLPNRPTYEVPIYAITIDHIVWSLVAGPLLGAAAIVYIKAIHWAKRAATAGWLLAVAPLFVFATLGLASFAFPQLLGNGKDIVQLALVGDLGFGLLLVLPVLKMIATAGCLASGAPGGLLTPTLACGATLGGLLGWIWLAISPGAPLGSYALIGAAAFLAATSQGPLSSVVLMLELTRTADGLMVPMILATVGALWVVRRTGLAFDLLRLSRAPIFQGVRPQPTADRRSRRRAPG